VRFRRAMEGGVAGGTRCWTRVPTAERPCLRADLRAVAAAVTAAGCGPVIVVDLTREQRICVVRVVVPGLEAASPPDVVPGPRARRAGALSQ